MRRNLIAFLLLLLAAPLLSTGQTRRGDTIADVPFSFIVEGQQLPPGRYVLSPVGETNIRISGSGTKGVLVATHDALRGGENGSKLVFHRWGDVHFLSSIWTAGNTHGRALYPSRTQRRLIQQGRESKVAEISVVTQPDSKGNLP